MSKVILSNECIEVEKRIIEYFNREKKIQSLIYKINNIKKQIERIYNEEMCYDNYRSPIYGDKVQSGKSVYSKVEDEYIGQQEKKERLIKERLKWIEELQKEVLRLEVSNKDLEYLINQLSEEDRELINLIYYKKLNQTQLGIKLISSQPTISKRKKKILVDLSNYINISC